jgi:hypothetical protein
MADDIELGPRRDPEAASKQRHGRIQWSPQGLIDGFPRTAAFIARDPDKTATVFRRFDELSARNLLILQGRVEALQAEQQLQDKQDFGLVARTEHPSYAVMSRALSYENFGVSAFDGHHTDTDNVPIDILERWRYRRREEAIRLVD